MWLRPMDNAEPMYDVSFSISISSATHRWVPGGRHPFPSPPSHRTQGCWHCLGIPSVGRIGWFEHVLSVRGSLEAPLRNSVTVYGLKHAQKRPTFSDESELKVTSVGCACGNVYFYILRVEALIGYISSWLGIMLRVVTQKYKNILRKYT